MVRLKPGDPNLDALLELHAMIGREPVIAQKFIPAVSKGDKRVLLVDGEPVGAINRVPAEGQVRSNMARGGRAEAVELSDRDREICKIIGPELRRRGLLFCGIDVIGDYLTEINVTSPTGAQQLKRFSGVDAAAALWGRDRGPARRLSGSVPYLFLTVGRASAHPVIVLRRGLRMVARVVTVAFEGVEARRVEVEVQLTSGEFAFVVVGLGDKAVAESRERVRAAFTGLGLALPGKRIIANLAPADLPKEGSHYDLPIALAVMAAMGILPPDAPERLGRHRRAVAGRPDRPGGRRAARRGRRQRHGPRPDLPRGQRARGGLGRRRFDPGAPLADRGGQPLPRDPGDGRAQARAGGRPRRVSPTCATSRARRAPSGRWRSPRPAATTCCFVGPPGSGKSMLAQRLPGLLPPLSARELLETSMVHSMAGLIAKGALTRARPFRAPHHSASMAALTGGGLRAKPGEVSLAHNGVLFLDELPEFSAQALDSLRARWRRAR